MISVAVNVRCEDRRCAEGVRGDQKLLAEVPGIYIENKGLTVAAHYRQAPSEYEGKLRGLVEEFVQQRDDFLRLCEGKKVFDLFPLDRLDKGSAVASLLAEHGGPAHALPIYCGDDATDETAFAALGPEAITVCVGAGDRASRARFRLSDPDEVGELIDRLDVCRRGKSHAG